MAASSPVRWSAQMASTDVRKWGESGVTTRGPQMRSPLSRCRVSDDEAELTQYVRISLVHRSCHGVGSTSCGPPHEQGSEQRPPDE